MSEADHRVRRKSINFIDILHYLSNASSSPRLHPCECFCPRFMDVVNVEAYALPSDTLTWDEFCYSAIFHNPLIPSKGSRCASPSGPSLYVNARPLCTTSSLFQRRNSWQQMESHSKRGGGLCWGLNLAPTFLFLTSSLSLSFFYCAFLLVISSRTNATADELALEVPSFCLMSCIFTFNNVEPSIPCPHEYWSLPCFL